MLRKVSMVLAAGALSAIFAGGAFATNVADDPQSDAWFHNLGKGMASQPQPQRIAGPAAYGHAADDPQSATWHANIGNTGEGSRDTGFSQFGPYKPAAGSFPSAAGD